MNLTMERRYLVATDTHFVSLGLVYGEHEWAVDIGLKQADDDPTRKQVAIALRTLADRVET